MASRLRKAIMPALLSSDESALGYGVQSCTSQLERDVEKWRNGKERCGEMGKGPAENSCDGQRLWAGAL